MNYDLIIRNGTVYSSSRAESVDIGIKDGMIAKLGNCRDDSSAESIDATGLAVLPGIVDTQVHFREPGMTHKEDLYTGSRAAIAGGVTTVFEMPNTIPTTSTLETLNQKLSLAEDHMLCNFGFFVGATTENSSSLAHLEMQPGTPGVKIFMGSSTGTLLVPDDETLREVLKNGRRRCPVHSEDHFLLEKHKADISAHPHPREHPTVRATECAVSATRRLLNLANETKRPVHILHLSTADEIPIIQEAQAAGVDATVEITPQHLFFSAPECYERLGTYAQMNPPLRSEEHTLALRQALSSGFFNVIGSDHAPHTIEEKNQPYPKSPSGMPGVQTIFPVMMTLAKKFGLLDIHSFIALACENPCSLYGIKDKGRIEVGYDADLMIADLNRVDTPSKSWLQSKAGWSPYEGERLTGWPIHTIVNGVWVVRDCTITNEVVGRKVKYTWKQS